MSAADTLIQKALELPDDERYRVFEALQRSFTDDAEFAPPDGSDWSAELKKRGDELDADPSAGISIDEVRRRIQVVLGATDSMP